jgi:hypothetical protein
MLEKVLTVTTRSVALPVGLVLNRAHTDRSTPVANEDSSLAENWSSAPPDQLAAHPAVDRFRTDLQQVRPEVAEDLTCFRGRREKEMVESWCDMGPPPHRPAGRYNAPGDDVFYLCNSARGVFPELHTKAGDRLFLQEYRVPINSLRVGNFASPALPDFLKAVFNMAEEEARQCRSLPSPFSQLVAQLVREAGFGGMIVPGVRGTPEFHYQNVDIFNVGDQWKAWSCRDAGFRFKLLAEV